MAAARVEWISDRGAFAALAPEWDRLAASADHPFAEHSWFAAWWEAFGAGGELAVCALRTEGRLAGVYPLWREDGVLRAMANDHTPVFVPLAEDDEALAVLSAVVVAAPASELVLPSMPAGPALTALGRAARDGRRLSATRPHKLSPIAATSGSWDDYRRRLKGRLTTVERRRRKMAREHAAELVAVEPPADLESTLEEGFRVEGSGWKGRAGTAILSTEEIAGFYRSIARTFHATGRLRLSRVALEGRAVAFDMSLLHERRLYLLKTGYDESFGHLSPGLVLRLSIVERCFELGLEAHELLGDDADWKRKFATDARQLYRFRSSRLRPVPVARHVYRRFGRPALRRAREAAGALRP
jgi:CelD/BcsL family acetyltransferase involved in cellulose biosynthesis